MTYIDYVADFIEHKAQGVPIFTEEISESLAKHYGLDLKKAAAATSVAIKRIMESKRISDLRCYQKGIYYRMAVTPFGETGINKDSLISIKYLRQDNGYETGLGFLHRLGLTTQMPAEQMIATNRAGNAIRHDKKLNVSICPPKTMINSENKRYLQTLDALDLMDKAPVDVDDPYAVLADHIQRSGLQYEMLLFYADQFYNRQTVMRLAHTAGRRKEVYETASR